MPAHSTITAFSYIRFSTAEQRKGDSLRRQTQKAEDYCRRKGWTLDASLTLHDLGVSAFRGKNALVGNLGEFLKAVERGTVLPGSILIVESIDRISRQGIDEGYDLIKGILKRGVRLVTLSPEREFGEEAVKSLSKGALEIQLILERAAEESERKSERIGAAWSQKKKAAQRGEAQPETDTMGKDCYVLTRRLPAWIQKQNGRMVLIPERATVVKQIFHLATAGYGIPSIVRKLTRDGVPPFGRSGTWTRSYVGLLLKDRRALGEYQPRRGKAQDGQAIANYYPAAVTDEEWRGARAAVSGRRGWKGRLGNSQVNLFVHLLKHARDGDNYIMTQRLSKRPGRPTRRFSVLINALSDQGKARAYSLPYLPFEKAILSCLRELDPHDILNGDDGPDEALSDKAKELAAVEAEYDEAVAFMDTHGFNADIGRRLTLLAKRKAALAAEVADLKQEAEHPLSETWGECHGLTDALEQAADPTDIRLRIRSALRRLLSEIRLLIVPRGQTRFAVVQIRFAGGAHRDYFLAHRTAWGGAGQPRRKRAAQSMHGSLADFLRHRRAPASLGALDLRRRADAEELRQFLEAVPLDGLWEETEAES